MRLSKRITSQILDKAYKLERSMWKNGRYYLPNKEDTVLSFAYGRIALLENGRTWQAILQGQVLL
jgi:hypothetical protein